MQLKKIQVILLLLLLMLIFIFLAGCTQEQVQKQSVSKKPVKEGTPQVQRLTVYDPLVDPSKDLSNFVLRPTNPYFTLTPGTRFVYEGETKDGKERVEVYVTHETKKVLGVNTTVVQDSVWLNGELIEDTKDWYAQDTEGNVWYFGKDAKELRDGKVVSSSGSWEAGVDGAKPGIIMKANPKVGESYKQEYYKGIAEDTAYVLAIGEYVTVPYGGFADCIKTRDWTPLEQGTDEYKYYCRETGGLVLEVGLEDGQKIQLIEIKREEEEKRKEEGMKETEYIKETRTKETSPAPAKDAPAKEIQTKITKESTGLPASADYFGEPIQPSEQTTTTDPIVCPDTKTLESFVACVVSHFGPFIEPTAAEQTDFQKIVRAMLDGACETIVFPSSLAGIYAARLFTDSDTAKTYCVLAENKDANHDGKVDRGWGTIIVNNAPKRELNIAITHPRDDWKTEEQGIGVFKGTESRTFFLAGAQRKVGTKSLCQPDHAHSSSDAAHNAATLFFAATQELDAWYGERAWHQLQFHGMSAQVCPGVHVYITNGLSTPPASVDKINTLKKNLLKQHSDWSVTVPGDDPSCFLSATTNVEGRYLNGVRADSVCQKSASISRQKFFSIEQAPGFRRAADWIAAVEDTWPVASAEPTAETSAKLTPKSDGGGTLQSTYFTSYGYNDNEDGKGNFGTAAIAYPSSQHPIATEGLGTYDDPITFATDSREIPKHTMIYVPYLQKYFRMEDACGACTRDWNNGKKWRTDLFMGGNDALQPEPALANCEAHITRKDIMYINPGPGYPVDTTPLFSGGVCTAQIHNNE